MNEIWKDIEGYEGRYQVSNLGNVKSLHQEYYGGHRKQQLIVRPETILAKRMNSQGYDNMTLSKEGKVRTLKTHRLVAQAFIPNPNDLPQVNHMDGNRMNNHVDNLEWCTAKENIVHGINKLGSKRACGVKQHLAKLNDELVRDIKICLEYGDSPYKLAPEYNVNVSTIQRIKRNETWKHVTI